MTRTRNKKKAVRIKDKSENHIGKKVRCRISGFTGIATSRIEYLNGCVQYGVRPRVGKDKKQPDIEYFDWQQLEVIGPGLSGRRLDDGPDYHPDAPKHR